MVLPSASPGVDPGYAGEPRKYGALIGSSENSTQRELGDRERVREAYWFAGNIQPGASESRFYVESNQMPGFTTAGADGGFIGINGGPTDQELEELEELRIWEYSDVTTLTFGPMFPTGAEPAEVLKNYRLGIAKLSLCSSIPHSVAFLSEIGSLLSEPGIEMKLGARLNGMKAKPVTPVELELMNCLRLVAAAFASH